MVSGNGVGKFRDTFTYLDLGTGCRYARPCRRRDTQTTRDHLNNIRGPGVIKFLYSDGAQDYKCAAKQLCILHETSTPGEHNSNARIEQWNGELQSDVRAALFAAGLPECWWSYAIMLICFIRNRLTSVDADGHLSVLLGRKDTTPMITGVVMNYPWDAEYGFTLRARKGPVHHVGPHRCRMASLWDTKNRLVIFG